MEFYWKLMMSFVIFMLILRNIQAASKSIDVFNTRPLSKNSYLPPLYNNAYNKTVPPTKPYITKQQRSIDNFNTRPYIKTTKLPTEYAPPPSGLVSHKNLPLPLSSTVKLPLLLSKSIKSNDFTKHPGFVVTPSIPQEIEVENTAPMLMIEEPAPVILQPQYNKTIEAAKTLASAFLEATGESTKNTNLSKHDKQTTSTDIFVVKTQKKAYIIPTHLKKEATKPSAVDDLYPLRDQFDKAYTVNQFIFVIKPERINFLNKLV